MNAQILAIASYSLFSTLLFSTSVMAMEQPEDGQSKLATKLTQVSLKYPVPPTVTINDYTSSLCLLDGKIDRWENANGNLASWLQAPANKKRIENQDGEALLDLPLFQDTLTPEIEEGKLRCDYSLPAADSDLSKGASTFSLYCKATAEEIEEVKKLKTESKRDYSMRLLQWQEMLKERQKFTKYAHSLFFPARFIPFVDTIKGDTGVSFPRETGRNESNYIYFNFDGVTMESKQFMHSEVIITYEPPIEEYKQGVIQDLANGFGNGNSAYYTAECPMTLSVPSLTISNNIYDIRGNLTIKTNEMKMGKNTYFWPMGSLDFQSLNSDCPISKIKIVPCNSKKPIQVVGSLELSDKPKIELEFINAAQIWLKFKNQK